MDHIYYQVSFKWDVDYLVEGCDKEKAFNEIVNYVNGNTYAESGYPRHYSWTHQLEIVYNADRSDVNSVRYTGRRNDGYAYDFISADSKKIVYKCYFANDDTLHAFKMHHGSSWEHELIENIKFNVMHSNHNIAAYNDVEAVARMRVTDVEVVKCER